MNIPEKIPLIATRPQIRRWLIREEEKQKVRVKKDIAKNRTQYMNFIRQIKKAQRASGVANEDFIPWLKFIVEIMEVEIGRGE